MAKAKGRFEESSDEEEIERLTISAKKRQRKTIQTSDSDASNDAHTTNAKRRQSKGTRSKAKHQNDESKEASSNEDETGIAPASRVGALCLKDTRQSTGIVGDSIVPPNAIANDKSSSPSSSENVNTINNFFRTVNRNGNSQSQSTSPGSPTKRAKKKNTPKDSKKKAKKNHNAITIDHFFSQAKKKTNFKNLKHQAGKATSSKSKTPKKSPAKPKGTAHRKTDKYDKIAANMEVEDIDMNDLNLNNSNTEEDEEMRLLTKESKPSIADKPLTAKKNSAKANSNAKKNRKRKLCQLETQTPKTSNEKKDTTKSNDTNFGKNTNNTNNTRQTPVASGNTANGSKNKRDTANATPGSADTDVSQPPPTKKRRFYAGYQRQDKPPMQGKTEIPVGKPYCLSGKKFVITGQLPSLTREECEDMIKQYGGTVTKAVSGVTRYLLTGDEPGESKVKKAKDKKVEMIDEAQFLDLVRNLPQRPPPKIKNMKNKTSNKSKSRTQSKSNRGNRDTTNHNGYGNGYNNNNSNDKSANGHSHDGNGNGGGGGDSELFVEKYRPQTIQELIGNKAKVTEIQNYLRNWDRIKNDHSSKAKRCCLVSGPPGIGKTTAVTVVAKQMGFNLIELNASDTRSKKQLEAHMSDSLNNRSMTEFFGVQNAKGKNNRKNGTKAGVKGKRVIVMDEVDGMSSGDRGGMQQLIKLIKISKIPIICICNDRGSQKVRSLANYCLDLRFRRPTANQSMSRLNAIAQREGLALDAPALNQLANGVHGDVRQMLHLLQFWRHDEKDSNDKVLHFQDVKQKMDNAGKDATMGPWDVMPRFFSQGTSCNDALTYYFVDHQLMPLFLHENYLRVSGGYRRLNTTQMNHVSEACESVADGDLIDCQIRSKQYYPLLPTHGILSTLRPGMLINNAQVGRPGSGGYQFPTWLGQFSKKRKNERLFSEVANHMHQTNGISGGSYGIAMDYLPMLKESLFKPMEMENDRGIDTVIEFMKDYGLSREDWNTIGDLGIGYISAKNRPNKVITKVKSAFTRQCNRELSGQSKDNGTSGKSIRATIKVNENGDPIDEQSDNENDDKKANSLKTDNLIKMKKGGKKKGATKTKGKAKRKTKAKPKSKTKKKGTTAKTKSKAKK